MTRCTPSNGPFKGGDDDLRVCFWNAGGLNNSKFLEVKNILFKFDADFFSLSKLDHAVTTYSFIKQLAIALVN
jgi:hypothetical protein